MKYLELGSVSHATMRAEDLIPRFMRALESVDADRAEAIREEDKSLFDWLAGEEIIGVEGLNLEERADELLNEVLFDALDGHCPPYCYFGSHPGDGADYGVWLSENWQQDLKDDGGIVVSDLSEVPADFDGAEVAVVNDHGNVTLYAKDGDKLIEIWSVV